MAYLRQGDYVDYGAPQKKKAMEPRLSISRAAAALGLVLLMVGSAHAAPSDKAVVTDTFEIGLEGESYQYREPTLDHLIGEGIGLNGTYTLGIDKWFFKANVIADFYNLDYDSNGTGSKSGTNDYMQDYRVLFGRQFGINRTSKLLPYIGFGFRELFDSDKAATSNGALGYDRRSEYLYIPIGASYEFHAGRWGLKPTAEYDYFIHGYQTTYLSDTGLDNNLHNDQTAGYGVRAEFMVTPPIGFYNFTFGPYLRYWSIHDSNVQPVYQGGVEVGEGLEPANNTTEIGLRTSLKF